LNSNARQLLLAEQPLEFVLTEFRVERALLHELQQVLTCWRLYPDPARAMPFFHVLQPEALRVFVIHVAVVGDASVIASAESTRSVGIKLVPSGYVRNENTIGFPDGIR